MRLHEHTQNGAFEAWVYTNEAGSISVVCKLLDKETCRKVYPASMLREARVAANHYVLSGHCPSCPGSITDSYFWKQYHARKEGGAA